MVTGYQRVLGFVRKTVVVRIMSHLIGVVPRIIPYTLAHDSDTHSPSQQ